MNSHIDAKVQTHRKAIDILSMQWSKQREQYDVAEARHRASQAVVRDVQSQLREYKRRRFWCEIAFRVRSSQLAFVVIPVVPFACSSLGFVVVYAASGHVGFSVSAFLVSLVLATPLVWFAMTKPEMEELRLHMTSLDGSIQELLEKQHSFDPISEEHGRIASEELSALTKIEHGLVQHKTELARCLEQLERENDWSRRAESIFNGPWRSLRGVPFEEFLCTVFLHLGYHVEITKASGDQGVDLVAQLGQVSWAVQAKGYSGNVGNSAVQQVYAGMKHYDCTACAVITNSDFTASARELAVSTNCWLIGEREMRALIFGEIFLRQEKSAGGDV